MMINHRLQANKNQQPIHPSVIAKTYASEKLVKEQFKELQKRQQQLAKEVDKLKVNQTGEADSVLKGSYAFHHTKRHTIQPLTTTAHSCLQHKTKNSSNRASKAKRSNKLSKRLKTTKEKAS